MSTTTTSVCTPPDGLALVGASGFYCLTRRQSVGLTAVAMSGFISLIAVLVIATLILRNVIRARNTPGRRLIAVPMDLFMLSLFMADLFQSLGVVLDVKWIQDGTVRVGHLCTAQGVLQNLGEAAVGMTTLIITLHTFAEIWWRKGVQSLTVAVTLVGLQWLFLILFVAVSNSIHKEFYTPTPYWCWISTTYPDYRTAGENFWLWLAFATSVLYIPLFFWSRGYVTPSPRSWWRFQIHSRREMPFEGTQKLFPLSLIVCALAYCIPVLPTSLARWFLAVHGDVKPFANSEAQFAVKAIFSLSGICDVVVFLVTRQGLLLFRRNERHQPSEPLPLQDMGQNPPDHTLRPVDNNGIDGHSSGIRIGALVSFWVIINGLDAVWIIYYIRSASDPNPRTAANRVHAGWKGYYVMMYTFNFFWGCVNFFMWSMYFQMAWEWFSEKRGTKPLKGQRRVDMDNTRASNAFVMSWFLVHFAVLVPVATVMFLGPFFSPFVGVKIAQKQAWNHRCDQFPLQVILEGRSFGSPAGSMPRASFYHGHDGLRTKYSEYTLIMDDTDENVWHFALSQLAPVTIPAEIYPLVQNITYQMANQTFSANCSSSGPVAASCMQGSFKESGHLSFTINDSNTDTVTNLRAVDNNWVFLPADDAPSFILKEVRPDNSLGQIALRTAVTEPGHCTSLKLCLQTGDDLLAPVGLALMRQDDYAVSCTTPNSN